jgi:hypothetical protein
MSRCNEIEEESQECTENAELAELNVINTSLNIWLWE